MRKMTADDAAGFYALNSNPRVMRFTGEPLLESVEAGRRALESYPDFESVGFGRWGCFLRSSGELIGFCGLKYLADHGEVDIGYRFRPEFWGRGLASEATSASVQFGFEHIGLRRIVGHVLPENAASIRVLEKCGLTFEGEFWERDAADLDLAEEPTFHPKRDRTPATAGPTFSTDEQAQHQQGVRVLLYAIDRDAAQSDSAALC